MKKLKKTKIFIFGKKSHNAEKKLKGGTLWDFSTSILSQNIKKMQGGPFEEKKFRRKKFRKKCLAVPKKMKGSLVSPGMVCYAEKQEKPFWFSSLDQIVHFDAIIFCRTFVELFWSVRVDRKKKSHYNSRVSLHEAPTKNGTKKSIKKCAKFLVFPVFLFGHFIILGTRAVLGSYPSSYYCKVPPWFKRHGSKHHCTM